MSQFIKITNDINTALVIEHKDGDPMRTLNGDDIVVNESGVVILDSIPTSDPVVANQLWNDSGTLKISTGV